MRKNIKPLTLILALALCQLAVAQKSVFTPEHEFRLGIGSYPIAESMDYFYKSDDISMKEYGYGDGYGGFYGNFSGDQYGARLTYHGPRVFTGSISAGYTYNMLRWLSVGATFTYAGDFQKRYDKTTDQEKEKNSANRFYLMPTVRFNYYNRPLIRLYSQIGVGISYINKQQHYKGKKHTTSAWGTSAQVTLLGISVGKQLFGFGEVIGTGVQGSFVFGIGYKFNAKNR